MGASEQEKERFNKIMQAKTQEAVRDLGNILTIGGLLRGDVKLSDLINISEEEKEQFNKVMQKRVQEMVKDLGNILTLWGLFKSDLFGISEKEKEQFNRIMREKVEENVRDLGGILTLGGLLKKSPDEQKNEQKQEVQQILQKKEPEKQVTKSEKVEKEQEKNLKSEKKPMDKKSTGKKQPKQEQPKQEPPKPEETIFQSIQKSIDETNKLLEQQYNKLNEAYDEIAKIHAEFTSKMEKAISQMQEAIQKKLPEPPKLEDVTVPQDKIQRIVKAVVPIMVGLTALFRPGRYGESIVYFNTLIQSMKANDMQKFAEALKQWELDFKYALQEKENNIKALELELQKVSILQQAGIKGAEQKAKRIEAQISQLHKVIENAHKAYERAIKILKTLHDMKINEEKLKIMRQKLSKENLPSQARLYEYYLKLPPEKRKEFLDFLRSLKSSTPIFGALEADLKTFIEEVMKQP